MPDVRPVMRQVEARVVDALATVRAVRQERGIFYVPNVGTTEDIDGYIGLNDRPYPNGDLDLAIYVGVRVNAIERLIATHHGNEKPRHLPTTFVRNYGYFGPERANKVHSLPAGFDLDRIGWIMEKVLSVSQTLWSTHNNMASVVHALEAAPGPYLTRASRIAAGYYLLNDQAALVRTIERASAENDRTALGTEFATLVQRLT